MTETNGRLWQIAMRQRGIILSEFFVQREEGFFRLCDRA